MPSPASTGRLPGRAKRGPSAAFWLATERAAISAALPDGRALLAEGPGSLGRVRRPLKRGSLPGHESPRGPLERDALVDDPVGDPLAGLNGQGRVAADPLGEFPSRVEDKVR